MVYMFNADDAESFNEKYAFIAYVTHIMCEMCYKFWLLFHWLDFVFVFGVVASLSTKSPTKFRDH